MTVPRSVSGSLAGCVAVLALLGGLATTVGLGAAGWLVGTATGVTVVALLARGLARRVEAPGLRPADVVTLSRAVLVCGAAGLVADGFAGQARPGPLVVLAAAALALDWVDGRVARRTGPTQLGARFDLEVDALLILVLSVQVAGQVGWWVLAIGLFRYALWLAERVVPWLRRPTPPRYWAKVVAAVVGIVLVAALVLPRTLVVALLVVALVLLVESFGWQLA